MSFSVHKFEKTDLLLPKELRAALAQSYGRVFEGEGLQPAKEVVNLLKEQQVSRVIAVGDVTVQNLLRLEYHPKICIIDYKTKRGSFQVQTSLKDYKTVKLINPAEKIKREAWKVIREALESPSRTLIEVEGEEDLLSLVVCLLGVEGDVLVYGLPNRGIIFLHITQELQQNIYRIVLKMIPVK
ncbi:MAG: GTP-dependent dephospho-CoA kinase family protein [Promethearchaeota archaeon]